MTTELQLMTADELLARPDDGFTYELIKGELIQLSPPPGHERGLVIMNIAGPLYQYVIENRLGRVLAAETGILLEQRPDTVRAADVAFISQKRINAAGAIQGYWKGAPDLAVEVVSPTDTVRRIENKVAQWLQAGSRLVWVVSPELKSVTIYKSLTDIVVLTAEDVLTADAVIPGFTIKVSDIFSI